MEPAANFEEGEDIIQVQHPRPRGEILFPLLVVLNMEKNIQAERQRERTPLPGGGLAPAKMTRP